MNRSIFSILSNGTINPTISIVCPLCLLRSAGTSLVPILHCRKSLKYNRCTVELDEPAFDAVDATELPTVVKNVVELLLDGISKQTASEMDISMIFIVN